MRWFVRKLVFVICALPTTFVLSINGCGGGFFEPLRLVGREASQLSPGQVEWGMRLRLCGVLMVMLLEISTTFDTRNFNHIRDVLSNLVLQGNLF